MPFDITPLKPIMNVIAIDTHEVVKELKAAGFSEDQAEAVTRVVRRAQDIDLSALAMKVDLDGLRRDTKVEFDAVRRDMKAEFDLMRMEIDALRKDIKAEFSDQKADLIKWIIGAIGFQTVAILGAALAFAHVLKP